MNKLNETIERIMGGLDTGNWVKCPLCLEEWNKLRPCSYFQNGKTVGTYSCVTCAESIQSIHRVFDLFGLDVSIHSRGRRQPYEDLYRTYGDYFDNARAFKCRVENRDPVVTVEIESSDSGLFLTHLEAKASMKFDNIFQCASYFQHLIDEANKKPQVDEDKNNWN
jgi:hypothetical protein